MRSACTQRLHIYTERLHLYTERLHIHTDRLRLSTDRLRPETLGNVLSRIVFDRFQCCIFIKEAVLVAWIGARIHSIVVLSK